MSATWQRCTRSAQTRAAYEQKRVRTLDVAVFQLLIVVQLLAVKDEADLYDVDALFFLQLIFEPQYLQGRKENNVWEMNEQPKCE